VSCSGKVKNQLFVSTNWIYLWWYVPEKGSELNWTRTTRVGGCRSVITSMKKPFSEEKLHSSDFLPWIISAQCRCQFVGDFETQNMTFLTQTSKETLVAVLAFWNTNFREVEMSTVLSALLRILLWVTNHSVQKILTKILFLGLKNKTEKPNMVQTQRHLVQKWCRVNADWLIGLQEHANTYCTILRWIVVLLKIYFKYNNSNIHLGIKYDVKLQYMYIFS